MSRRIKCFVIIIIFAAVFILCKKEYKENLSQSVEAKVLRLHILANSDSDEDQKVKLKVRDAIGRLLSKELDESKSLDRSEEIIESEMSEITETAEQILKKNGFYYGVAATLTRSEFPEKTYGSYTFPEGEYEALQITLGDGAGHNWWCVLYPNLCFRGSLYEVDTESSGEKLREVLTDEEYDSVLKSKDVQIRFKFLEYFR